MGINITYYIVNENDIEKLKAKDLDFETYLSDHVTKIHEYKGFWFKHNVFDQGIKSWNPLIELICCLDTSSNNVCRKILNENNLNPDSVLGSNFYLIKPSTVVSIFEELKKISLFDIELATENPELIAKVVNAPGYHMYGIKNKQSMVIEFMELINAFYTAQQGKKAIVINLG